MTHNSIPFLFFSFLHSICISILRICVISLHFHSYILVILHVCSLFYIICNWTGFWRWNQPLRPSQPVSSRFTLFTPFISPPSYPSRWESGWPHQSVCPGLCCPGSKDLLLVLWSLSQSSLKGRLPPSSNNPPLSTQVEQKSTQCNPVDRGRIENVAWPHHTTSWHQLSLS